MAVGPQYQSQLALLAGALGHGLDSSTGLQLYQQTMQDAAAAKAQRQATIADTLGQLSQIATGAATQGQTPEQVQELVQATKAGLPMAQSHAVRHGVHGILGSLADYTATPDPMAQAQLQGQLIQNQQAAYDLQNSGTADLSNEQGIFGPAHQQLVQNLTQQYFNAGMPAPEIRSRIIAQLGPEFTQDVKVPATGMGVPTKSGKPVPGGKMIDQQMVEPGTPGLIDQTISATLAQIDPTYMSTHPGGALAAAAGLTPSAPPASDTPTLASLAPAAIGALRSTPNSFGIGALNPDASVPPPPGQAPQPPSSAAMNYVSGTLGSLRWLLGNPGGQ